MVEYLAIPIGALLSASAQIILKKSSDHANWSAPWALFFMLSAFLYALSMLVYLFLLRHYPISRIYPTMTLLVILVVTVYGFLLGEQVSPRTLFGLALGVGSICVLLA